MNQRERRNLINRSTLVEAQWHPHLGKVYPVTHQPNHDTIDTRLQK
jgi:hypothetical protein